MKRVRGSVTTVGDADIVEGGGHAEIVVATWWDSLNRRDATLIARLAGADVEDLGQWDELSPFGQQMRIHMWFDENCVHTPMSGDRLRSRRTSSPRLT